MYVRTQFNTVSAFDMDRVLSITTTTPRTSPSHTYLSLPTAGGRLGRGGIHRGRPAGHRPVGEDVQVEAQRGRSGRRDGRAGRRHDASAHAGHRGAHLVTTLVTGV